jgi:SAM-dependent methyltransferase
MHAAHDPYDSFAYPGFSFPDAHPDRLAAMAILHGLNPAPVEHCRVLEIGCNEGGNLIPMAYAIPDSEFVGFDLARLPIERGQERIRELGLKNIRIFQGNLLDAGTELGSFDYILAHGFYAWVPEPVRDRLLALCGESLTANGVAFVSYNALPGGHLRSMIREMMLYSAEGIDDPERRVSEGLGFLRFVVETRAEGDAFRLLLAEQLEKMEKRSASATYHDELSDAYHPVQFSEFAEHARKHGLQYLCEAVYGRRPIHVTGPIYGRRWRAGRVTTSCDKNKCWTLRACACFGRRCFAERNARCGAIFRSNVCGACCLLRRHGRRQGKHLGQKYLRCRAGSRWNQTTPA